MDTTTQAALTTRQFVKSIYPCRLYQSGSCKFGDSCRFAHIIDAPINNNNGVVGRNLTDEPSSALTPVINQNNSNSVICNLYQKGFCKFGDSCKFSHAIENNNSNNNNNNNNNNQVTNFKVPTCRLYQVGPCKFGDKCKYLHELASPAPLPFEPFVPPTNKQIYIGNIKANITTGFKITNLLLDSNNSTHLIIKTANLKPPILWTSSEVINDELKIKCKNLILQDSQIKLYFNNPEDLKDAEQIIKETGICKQHTKINCESISCIMSTKLNKLQVTKCCKSYFNELIVTPTSTLTMYTLQNYLTLHNITGIKKIRELGKDTKNHKFSIKFESDIQSSVLLHKCNIFPGCPVTIGNDIIINYKPEDLNFLEGKTLEDYITPFFATYFAKPKIEMPIGENKIYIRGGTSSNRLIAKRQIIKLTKPQVINYSRALLNHVTKAIMASWQQDINVNIDVNVTYGKIILKGLPDDRNKVANNINEYFQNERHELVSEAIPITNYKSLIKREVINEYDSITKMGVDCKILPDDIIISGPRAFVDNAVRLLTNIIELIITSYNKLDTSLDEMNNVKVSLDTPTCVFCAGTVSGTIKLKTCDCTYCRDCFKHVLLSTLSNSNVDTISCLSCNTPVLLSDANILNKDELMTIQQAALNKYLTINWNKYYKCPTPDCDNYMELNDQTLFYCNLCSTMYCKNCDVDYLLSSVSTHESVTCANFQELKKNDAKNQSWITSNTKKCPNCTIPIEKNEGCNHMTCFRCRYQFCWKCLKLWNPVCYRCTINDEIIL